MSKLKLRPNKRINSDPKNQCFLSGLAAHNQSRKLEQVGICHSITISLTTQMVITGSPETSTRLCGKGSFGAKSRIDHALIAEGLCPGVGKAATGIYQSARQLRAYAMRAQLNSDIAPRMWSQLCDLISHIRSIQQTIGEVLRTFPR